MKVFRVIVLASLLLFSVGSAFAGNNQDGDSQGGHTYAAPELDFGSLQYALLGLGGVSAFLFGRRGRR